MTLNGIDVLQQQNFQPLRGRHIALITNHTGVNQNGIPTVDILHNTPGLQIHALFTPEHGLRGTADENVPDSHDHKTGLPVYSLYGQRKRPEPHQLAGIDTLVFDIQDIGCRFYTYITTLLYTLETAAQHHLRYVVLDRPNPINGRDIEGPLPDPERLSFTACHPLPIRHGMTTGELAQLFRAEKQLPIDLHIVPLHNWKRHHFWDHTNLTWINPSPNMRSLTQALLYPGIGLLEFTNLSVGRGTDTPFELLGAPWIDARKLAAHLNNRNIPGFRCIPVRFTPRASTHAHTPCHGLQLLITDRRAFAPVHTGIEIAHALHTLFPQHWQHARYITLLAHHDTYHALLQSQHPEHIRNRWIPHIRHFAQRRKPHLLYT